MDSESKQSILLSDGLKNKITGVLLSKPVILQFLKFAGIGFLTTAIDFLLFNLISKFFAIESGIKLSAVNALTFIIALAHSYVWNGNWTFGFGKEQEVVKSFFKTVLIGFIGVVGVALAVLGGKSQANPLYYLLVLLVLGATEIVVWKSFTLGWFEKKENTVAHTMLAFALVSLIGAGLNSGIVGFLTKFWPITVNIDLNKNLAKVIATVFSLIWNFVGYKIFVFKK